MLLLIPLKTLEAQLNVTHLFVFATQHNPSEPKGSHETLDKGNLRDMDKQGPSRNMP